MWELIEINKRKSMTFLFLLGTLLFAVILLTVEGILQYVITVPEDLYDELMLFGLLLSVIIFVPTVAFQLFKVFRSGYQDILMMAGAQQVFPSKNSKMLCNVVEEMVIASGFKGKPDIYIIEDSVPNAFAVGINEKKCAIAVTSSLLKILNREELQAVIAHEMAHLYNRDSLFLTIASFFVGAILGIASSMSFTGGGRSSGRGGNLVSFLILIVIMLIVTLVAPLIARMLFFMTSRKREYLADACAVQFTRNPGALASALTKISSQEFKPFAKDFARKSEAQMPLYINNPSLAADKESLFATHPPIKKRISILLKLAQGSIIDYQKVYAEECGEKLFSKQMLQESVKMGHPLPPTPADFAGGAVVMGLQGASGVAEGAGSGVSGVETPVSASSQTQSIFNSKEKIAQKRMANNIMWESVKYSIVECDCGTTLKIPPCYTGKPIKCPHCGKVHTVEKAA